MISIEQTKKIADLARLDLSDSEFERFRSELNLILEYFDRLGSATLPQHENGPEKKVVNLMTLRKDIFCDSLAQEEALANAPSTIDGMFKVPKVI